MSAKPHAAEDASFNVDPIFCQEDKNTTDQDLFVDLLWNPAWLLCFGSGQFDMSCLPTIIHDQIHFAAA